MDGGLHTPCSQPTFPGPEEQDRVTLLEHQAYCGESVMLHNLPLLQKDTKTHTHACLPRALGTPNSCRAPEKCSSASSWHTSRRLWAELCWGLGFTRHLSSDPMTPHSRPGHVEGGDVQSGPHSSTLRSGVPQPSRGHCNREPVALHVHSRQGCLLLCEQ